MKKKDHHEKLLVASVDCSRCGTCVDSCELLGGLGLRPGEIARTIVNGEAHDDTIAAVQRCDLCGLCGQHCESGLEPSEMMLAARTVLHQGTDGFSNDLGRSADHEGEHFLERYHTNSPSFI